MNAPDRPTRRSPATTRTLDRGLRVLELVAERPNRTLGEIAAAVELSPATALRILDTLRARDFVARDEASKTYRVGLRALEVGARFLSETRLQETARILLRRLSEDTGQTVTLAIVEDRSVVYLDVVEGRGALRSSTGVGTRLPAHATASGKVLLAWKWEAGLRRVVGPEPFEARTERTLTRLDALRRELAEVRRTAVAFDREELNLDVTCIAAAVRDRDGGVIAAVGVQGLTRQIDGQEAELAARVRDAAEETSLRLGWRPGATGPIPSDDDGALID